MAEPDVNLKVRLRVSFRGQFMRESNKQEWKYMGGQSILESVPAGFKYSDVMFKLCEKIDGAVTLKYQLPGEDLDPDALISVTDDDDLKEMFEEYFRGLRMPGTPVKTFRLRVFLFPAEEEPFTPEDILDGQHLLSSRTSRLLGEGKSSFGSNVSSGSGLKESDADAMDLFAAGFLAGQESKTWGPTPDIADGADGHRSAVQYPVVGNKDGALRSPNQRHAHTEFDIDMKSPYDTGLAKHCASRAHGGAFSEATRFGRHRPDRAAMSLFTQDPWFSDPDHCPAASGLGTGSTQPSKATGLPSHISVFGEDAPGVRLPSHISAFGDDGDGEFTEPAADGWAGLQVEGGDVRMTPGLSEPYDDPQSLSLYDPRPVPPLPQPSGLLVAGGNHHTNNGTGGSSAARAAAAAAGGAGLAGAGGSGWPPAPPLPKKLFSGSSDGKGGHPGSSVALQFPGVHRVPRGQVKVLRLIGEGAFGEVSEAETVTFGVVAVKWLKANKAERHSQSFWKEADTLSALNHPNVLRFYGVVLEEPDPPLVVGIMTEFMRSGSLSHLLRQCTHYLPLRLRADIALQAACGMAYLHDMSIVHFDLKPDNLLVDGDWATGAITVKVADFGLSKQRTYSHVSGMSDLRGTLPYMAPELVHNIKHVTQACDIWSFGVCLWEMLTLQVPHASLKPEHILAGLMSGSLQLEVPEWCEPEWRGLMEACWEVNPAARPNFRELIKHLQRVRDSC